MHLKDLKKKAPADLVSMAEELGVEGASTLRKQDLMFAILKAEAENGEQIMGEGTIEVLPDGFGFLRSPEANFLAGPDDIYVSPNQVRKFGLRTGDTVEGEIRAPKDGERYFALTKLTTVNFDDPDVVRHRVNFDNLTPLYPDEKLTLEIENSDSKDPTLQVIDIVAPLGKGQRALIVSPPRTGKNAQGNSEWLLPDPPTGSDPHDYVFQLFALDLPLVQMPGASREELEKAMQGRVTGLALLTGKYAREEGGDYDFDDEDEAD